MEQNRCTEEKLMKESCISLFTVFSTCGSSSIKVDIYSTFYANSPFSMHKNVLRPLTISNLLFTCNHAMVVDRKTLSTR